MNDIRKEDILSICDSIKSNNNRYEFCEKHLKEINSIFKEYENKKITDETIQEIEAKIKKLSGDIKFVDIDLYRHNVKITLNDWSKIILYPTIFSDWFYELTCYINYVEYGDIEEKARELLLEKRKLEKEKIELERKINEFNSLNKFAKDLQIRERNY